MRLWIRISILAVACLLLVGIVPTVRIFYRMEVPRHIKISEVTKVTGLRFPAGAALLHSALQEGADWSIQAVIKIKQADTDKLITSTKQVYTLDEVTAFEKDEKSYGHPRWWTPHKASQFRDFLAVSRIAAVRGQARMRVTMDGPHYSVVYLDWTGKP